MVPQRRCTDGLNMCSGDLSFLSFLGLCTSSALGVLCVFGGHLCVCVYLGQDTLALVVTVHLGD